MTRILPAADTKPHAFYPKREGKYWLLAILLLLLAACSAPPPTPTPTPAGILSFGPVPTLAPTFTLPPTVAPLPTTTPLPATPPTPTQTPPALDTTIIELRYTIPALELDRRLQATLGNQVILVDETTKLAVERTNQGGVVREMLQALPELVLMPLPEGCNTCVHLRFELPEAGISGDGWLQDPVFLASVENYMSVALGPHFPPETVLGLRRSASPFAPAHSLAMLPDGRFWLWLATEDTIDSPMNLPDSAVFLQTLIADLPLDTLAEQYTAACPGSPVESLLLAQEETRRLITIVCPEFSLPVTLLPLYLAVDGLLAPKIADVSLPRPPAAFPLAALADYKRADGTRLTLFQDGEVIARSGTQVVTSTLEITEVISLTNGLLSSGLVQPGLTTFRPTPTPATTVTATVPTLPVSVLLVRGEAGVLDGSWTERPSLPVLDTLDELLNNLLGITVPEPKGTAVLPQPTSTPQQTPTPSDS